MSKDSIKKLYIEPTSSCNFNCVMCPRNSWIDEKIGDMGLQTYQALINQAKEISSLDTIFFGGVAEPMSHKDIFRMVEIAKSLDVRVELITNGSLINEDTIAKLLKAGLDMLWFSIDSAHNDSYDLNVNDNTTGLCKAESRFCSFGNINQDPIKYIWNSLEYRDFSDRVKNLTFHHAPHAVVVLLLKAMRKTALATYFTSVVGAYRQKGLRNALKR